MTSYLRSWLYTGTAAAAPAPDQSQLEAPTIQRISPPASDDEDDGEDTETERGKKGDSDDEDDDAPPAFPALNSAQRASSSSSSSPASRNRGLGVLTDSQLMPPPPPPSLAVRKPGVQFGAGSSSLLGPGASGPGMLAVPPTTTKPPPKPKKGKKVALAPGFGPLDWAALKASGKDLRGVDTLLRVTPSVLKQHNKPDDAWTALNGKVYNITPYLHYHPGGDKELMRVAGRDGTRLFALTHAWVNGDFMLDGCMVGFLVSEPSS